MTDRITMMTYNEIPGEGNTPIRAEWHIAQFLLQFLAV